MSTLVVALATIAAVALFFFSLIRWRFGLFGLLIYLPFAGLVSLKTGQSAVGLLAKDIVFVIPAYVSFFLGHPQALAKARLPGLFAAALILLLFLVVCEVANPNVWNVSVAIIGIKVWLFYIPLAFMAAAAINTDDDLVRLLRILVAGAFIPLTVGFLQRFGIEAIGREATIAVLYGGNFGGTDYNLFADFNDYGGAMDGVLYRINSTFSSTGQYYTYTLAMISLSFALATVDRNRTWRLFARMIVLASALAAFLSGARGAAVFVPLVFAPMLLLGGRPTYLVAWVVLIPLVYVMSLTFLGIDVGLLLDWVLNYTVYYGQEYGWNRVFFALSEFPLGIGTGMNTNAARYALSGSDAENVLNGVESYYVKTIMELSFVGLAPVLIMIFAPLVRAVSLSRFGQSADIRQCAAALSGVFLMVAILSVRAWPLDVDPVNVMFWVLVGVLYKLPSIVPATRVRAHTRAETARTSAATALPAE